MIGQQNPSDAHGHVSYFTPLNPGARRGISSDNGGYSTDYNSFWCCQGTGLETQTKLMDSVYFHSGTTLIVNLFTPSVLTWSQRGITVTQVTSFPASDTTTLQVTGDAGGSWSMRIRIPSWTSGATTSVNGAQQSLALDSGGNVAAHSALKQWNWDGSTNLQWQLVGLGDGYYRIVKQTNGLVADSWGNTANGASCLQGPWNGGNNQQWRLNSLGNGRYQIVNRGTGTALDGGGKTTVGSTMTLWTPNASTNNQYTLSAV
jgi:hypothetical protein